MDELRHADSKLFELETMAARDWQEGYMAKVEREERENALKHFRNSEANDTLAQQVAYKRAHEAAEREQLAEEKANMRALWAQADKEIAEQAEREKIATAVERKKVDAFMYIQREERERKEHEDKEEDRQFVQSVLAKDRLRGGAQEG